jgi:GT2 family glycosyltransferase
MWHPSGAGCAGGCLFIASEAFKTTNGYRELGVYDSDDGFLMLDMAKNGFFLATAKTINVIHPYSKELKENYNKWKSDILHNRRFVGDGTYEDKLKDAEVFWK